MVKDRENKSHDNLWWLILAIAIILVVGTIKKKGNESLKILNYEMIKKDSIKDVVDSIEIPSINYFDTVFADRCTRYNPSEEQCDKTPYLTADQSFIDVDKLRSREIRWCALSWDLMYDEYRQDVTWREWAWKGDIEFGDTITIISKSKPFINGQWIVHDVMNERYKNSIDLLFHEDNMIPKLGVCKDVKILIKNKYGQ